MCLISEILRYLNQSWPSSLTGVCVTNWHCKSAKIHHRTATLQVLVSYHLKLKIIHDDVIEWKHFLRYWPFVQGIHRSPVNSPHKGQWRGALMFSLICIWINGWVNNREAGDLGRYRVHYDITVMHYDTLTWLVALQVIILMTCVNTIYDKAGIMIGLGLWLHRPNRVTTGHDNVTSS